MSRKIWRRFYYPVNGGGGGGGGGSPVYTAAQFVSRAELAFQQITCYCSGGWGQPLTPANKQRMINKNSFNYTYRNIINAQPSNSFAFDCICLIKGILWAGTRTPAIRTAEPFTDPTEFRTSERIR